MKLLITKDEAEAMIEKRFREHLSEDMTSQFPVSVEIQIPFKPDLIGPKGAAKHINKDNNNKHEPANPRTQ